MTALQCGEAKDEGSREGNEAAGVNESGRRHWWLPRTSGQLWRRWRLGVMLRVVVGLVRVLALGPLHNVFQPFSKLSKKMNRLSIQS
jgi:hypothetical protein